MQSRFTALLVALLAIQANAAGMQERTTYDDHAVVRVKVDGMRDTRTLLALGGRLWSESWGVRTVDVMLPIDRLDALENTKIDFSVLIPDVETVLAKERARLEADQEGGIAGGAFFDDYQRADDLIAFYDALATSRPDLVERRSIGTSIEGREIPAYVISNAQAADAPAIYICTGVHAREWIAPATIAYFADRLVNTYDTDPRVAELVGSIAWHIVPLANPDGYIHTWDVDRLWRKNRRNNINGTFGVDLNRNFDSNWGGAGSSGSTSSDTYRGTSPFSEPEAAAIRDDVLSTDNLAVFLDVHCFSQLVLWPYGYQDSEPAGDAGAIFQNLGFGIRNAIASVNGANFTAQPAHDLYIASGTTQDWAWDDTGALAFTYELRDTGNFGFVLPPEQIVPSGQEISESLLYIGEQVVGSVNATFPNGRPTQIAPASPATVEVRLESILGGVVPETARIRRKIDGGAWTTQSMTFLGDDLYLGTLTMGLACGEVVEFDFEIEAVGGALVRVDDGGSPWSAVATEETVAFLDGAESDLGWTLGLPEDDAATGIWTRVDPIGTILDGAAFYQPEDDASDPGTICFVTGQGPVGGSVGAADIDGGATTLVTPSIDTSDIEIATVSFAYWYRNDGGASPNADSMPVETSVDGGATWSPLTTIASSAAEWRSFDAEIDVEDADSILVRFVASDLGDGSLVEAAIDDFSLTERSCPDGPECPGDLDGNGMVDGADLGAMLAGWGDCQGCSGDFDGDGRIDGLDLGQFLASWGLCP